MTSDPTSDRTSDRTSDLPCVTGAAAEPLPGTAPHRPTWALLEHPGPWGREAVLDAPWPRPGLGAALQAAFDAAGVRVVLARRHGRRGQETTAPAGRTTLLLARCGPGGWAGRTTLDDAAAVLDLDLAALVAATDRPRGWADPGAVWAVCTQGTRDACCARLGRPLAEAFAAADPDATWEISHSGGHRFAGVAFALPEGLLYGRVGPQDVPALVEARAQRRVVRALLRGAVHRSPAQQAAEAALREHLDDDRVGALHPTGATTWAHEAGDGTLTSWQVEVGEVPVAARPASCGKPAEPAAAWVATGLTRLGSAG